MEHEETKKKALLDCKNKAKLKAQPYVCKSKNFQRDYLCPAKGIFVLKAL